LREDERTLYRRAACGRPVGHGSAGRLCGGGRGRAGRAADRADRRLDAGADRAGSGRTQGRRERRVRRLPGAADDPAAGGHPVFAADRERERGAGLFGNGRLPGCGVGRRRQPAGAGLLEGPSGTGLERYARRAVRAERPDYEPTDVQGAARSLGLLRGERLRVQGYAGVRGGERAEARGGCGRLHEPEPGRRAGGGAASGAEGRCGDARRQARAVRSHSGGQGVRTGGKPDRRGEDGRRNRLFDRRRRARCTCSRRIPPIWSRARGTA